jgi:hypothetical protein
MYIGSVYQVKAKYVMCRIHAALVQTIQMKVNFSAAEDETGLVDKGV